MCITSATRSNKVITEQIAIKLIVKYLNRPSFTFATDKYTKNGIIMKSATVVKYETSSAIPYKAAKWAQLCDFSNKKLLELLFWIITKRI